MSSEWDGAHRLAARRRRGLQVGMRGGGDILRDCTGEVTRRGQPYTGACQLQLSLFDALTTGMLGDDNGMLKLLFHRKNLKLLGVHAMGERATEIIHIGQAVISFGGTIEYFRDAVFNYPTLAEAYKVAALDGLNRL